MQTQTQRCEGEEGIMYEAYIVYNEQVVRAVIGGPYDGGYELKGESNGRRGRDEQRTGGRRQRRGECGERRDETNRGSDGTETETRRQGGRG